MVAAFLLFVSQAKASDPELLMGPIRPFGEALDKRANAGFEGNYRMFPELMVTVPTITVRFANPQYDCITEEYCLNVEFQSDLAGQELFGMNVRFFYEDNVLELIDFRDFEGGYDVQGTPIVTTSNGSFGYNFFGFGVPGNGAADYVNGSIQLVDQSQPPIYISTGDWTRLFQICFTIDDPDPNTMNFCPPLVWDLELNPANGGYLPGSDGIVITVVGVPPFESAPANENVNQFNWMYIGNGSSPPFGQPTETDCISIECGLQITCPADIIIDCGESTNPSNTGTATAADNCAGDPVITYSDSTAAGTCGDGNMIFRSWTATDGCNNVNTCQQIITIDDRGNICGAVLNDLGQPIAGVQLMLYVDVNTNQFIDAGDTLKAVTYSDSTTGVFCFNLVDPCAYIIKESQPLYHSDLHDYDFTPDPDGNDSIDGPDNEIPVLLAPCESDSNNNFVDIVCPLLFPSIPPDTICENGSVIFEIIDLNIGVGTVTYNWDFGSGSSPVNGSGLGPHTVTYMGTAENQSSGAAIELTLGKEGCPDTSALISQVLVNPYPDASINGSTSPGCYYTNRVFQPVQAALPGATYEWNFGIGAIPPSATGYGPHTVYYDTAGTKTVSLVIYHNQPGAQCPDSAALTFNITACPGQITGTVKSITNNPIPGVNVQLFADMDTNGIQDNSDPLRSVFTSGVGFFSMATITPGHYVMVQIQPIGWISFDDGDLTNDNDVVDNTDSLDNTIPVSVGPGEFDSGNYYTESPAPGTITGSVFWDLDGDEFPDTGEGVQNVSISLFADADTDGTADTIVPLATTNTLPNGSYSFVGISVGQYVLVETQLSGTISIKDFDATNDGDNVPNTNMENDTLPVTITNGETDASNYFIDADSCSIIVSNTNDADIGSLRHAIGCAMDGDTIIFHPSLAGLTIDITSARLTIDKDLVFYCTTMPRVKLESQITGLFDIMETYEVEFRQLDIVSGLAGNLGAAFKNQGSLKLHDVHIFRNPLLPPGEYLIHNNSTSELSLSGSCILDMNQ